jgi:hypothetical protein
MKWGEGFKVNGWEDVYLILRIIIVFLVIVLLLTKAFNIDFLLNLFNLMFQAR